MVFWKFTAGAIILSRSQVNPLRWRERESNHRCLVLGLLEGVYSALVNLGHISMYPTSRTLDLAKPNRRRSDIIRLLHDNPSLLRARNLILSISRALGSSQAFA